MSRYLDLARRSRLRWEDLRSQPGNEPGTVAQTGREDRPIQLTSDGRKLEAAGYKPKERCDMIMWQRPDTGFWVSQEMALHLLESKSVDGDHKA
jgi:hypothetical protein